MALEILKQIIQVKIKNQISVEQIVGIFWTINAAPIDVLCYFYVFACKIGTFFWRVPYAGDYFSLKTTKENRKKIARLNLNVDSTLNCLLEESK